MHDGKLTIIANPLLIKRLRPLLQTLPLGMAAAVEEARNFYGSLLTDMTDADWQGLINELASPQKERKAKATARNIEFVYKNGERKVMGGNQAIEYAVSEVGIDKCMTINVLHKGERLVVRQRDMRYETYYKPLAGGRWLNVKGSVADKVKTLRVLTSLLRLPFTVSLTNDLPE